MNVRLNWKFLASTGGLTMLDVMALEFSIAKSLNGMVSRLRSIFTS